MNQAVTAVTGAGLAAGYGGRPVWSGADFSIQAGSFTAVLGPNGSGKSTLVTYSGPYQKCALSPSFLPSRSATVTTWRWVLGLAPSSFAPQAS